MFFFFGSKPDKSQTSPLTKRLAKTSKCCQENRI
ncbi:Uncharacterized protein APZ42_027134 [Daphnia magna]|uniref:Uncharacterized protein n=1 Tax=Daphnia magna TaxID=35525 RepID=A0A164RAS6_9CRUS|nr:Uncharacterized protein APZ42_027134 [Daphnia magna]